MYHHYPFLILLRREIGLSEEKKEHSGVDQENGNKME